MGWIRNPFSKTKSESEPATPAPAGPDADPAPTTHDNADPESGDRPRHSTSSFWHHHVHEVQAPTKKLTGRQFFYIFVVDGLGAMALSGGINFAIAYAMYTTQDLSTNPIRLWQLPNTLAGDAGLTTIIQNIITWLIELLIVQRDLKHGGVAAIGFVPKPTHPFLRCRPLRRDPTHPPPPNPNQDATPASSPAPTARDPPGPVARFTTFLLSQALRAFLVAVASFVLLWPPAVGILTAVGTRSGGDWVFEKTWAPQVFKLVYGGVLALLTTPPFAAFWLIRGGWAQMDVAATAEEGREGEVDRAVPVVGGGGVIASEGHVEVSEGSAEVVSGGNGVADGGEGPVLSPAEVPGEAATEAGTEVAAGEGSKSVMSLPSEEQTAIGSEAGDEAEEEEGSKDAPPKTATDVA
ncbi:hypothetical protein B0H67DRAFT_556793 [Lasiosphaeris hirsuta]|uniref:Uncharacterized protein n=1 Tax=Lasiosphaeris hirsuta TaxID=260670 RepID=A0AA40DM56_9PEZI|nr:hypothetical protein B0H67DRAFT_556793 [Lasiosphaeris hirsuta]